MEELKNRIEKTKKHAEIFNIIKQDDVYFKETSKGAFINLSELSKERINDIMEFLNRCDAEKKKNEELVKKLEIDIPIQKISVQVSKPVDIPQLVSCFPNNENKKEKKVTIQAKNGSNDEDDIEKKIKFVPLLTPLQIRLKKRISDCLKNLSKHKRAYTEKDYGIDKNDIPSDDDGNFSLDNTEIDPDVSNENEQDNVDNIDNDEVEILTKNDDDDIENDDLMEIASNNSDTKTDNDDSAIFNDNETEKDDEDDDEDEDRDTNTNNDNENDQDEYTNNENDIIEDDNTTLPIDLESQFESDVKLDFTVPMEKRLNFYKTLMSNIDFGIEI